MIFVFVWLPSLPMIISISIHVAASDIISWAFPAQVCRLQDFPRTCGPGCHFVRESALQVVCSPAGPHACRMSKSHGKGPASTEHCHWAQTPAPTNNRLRPRSDTSGPLWPRTRAHSFSRVWVFVTPWTVAHQALLSLGFSPPGDLPDPGFKPGSPVSPALSGGFFITESPGKSRVKGCLFI